MSLRPRYSLLTLLVLTALIAGGVKLWRGPHHVVMSNPPTAAEAALLARIDSSNAMRCYNLPIVQEYEYRMEGGQRQYLFVKGAYANNLGIPIDRFEEAGKGPSYSLNMSLLGSAWDYAKPITRSGQELAVCWLYNPNTKARETPVDDLIATNTVDFYNNQIPCYIISTRKKIYQISDGAWFVRIYLTPVELSQIADAEFRECVMRELAKVPDHL